MDIKIGGYPLDKEQSKIATSNDKELLVVAGAGSGEDFYHSRTYLVSY